MNVLDELKELQKQQQKLQGQIGDITRKADDLKKSIAVEASGDLLKNLKLLGDEFQSGRVFDLWEKVNENLGTLRQNDPEFHQALMAGKYGLKFKDLSSEKFFVNLIGNCLVRSNLSLRKFLSYLTSKPRVGSWFFKEGE